MIIECLKPKADLLTNFKEILDIPIEKASLAQVCKMHASSVVIIRLNTVFEQKIIRKPGRLTRVGHSGMNFFPTRHLADLN